MNAQGNVRARRILRGAGLEKEVSKEQPIFQENQDDKLTV